MAKLTSLAASLLSLATVAGAVFLPGQQHSLKANHLPFEASEDAFSPAAFHPPQGAFGSLFDEVESGTHDLFAASDDRLDDPTLTIYQLLSRCREVSKFVELINENSDIVDMLNSTAADHTLFIVTDDFFEHLPKDYPVPPKDVVDSILRYNIAPGNFPLAKLIDARTIPTVLNGEALGDEAQRLRVALFNGVRLNFYSKVVDGDYKASNGYIHVVNHLLYPAQTPVEIAQMLPSQFSTLLYAWYKTGFVSWVRSQHMAGATGLFYTNEAWESLGFRANYFLFNEKEGLKYLDAILKYSVTPNFTFYSDAIYDHTNGGKGGDAGDGGKGRTKHYHPRTFLGDARLHLAVEPTFDSVKVKINGQNRVLVDSVPTRPGSLQVLNKIALPKRHHKHKSNKVSVEGMFEDGISVKELRELFDPYLE